MNTKEKIISAAIQVFNQQGYAATTMQDIANSMSVNRRNISYHFNNKALILACIATQMWDQYQENLKARKEFPSFENLNNELNMYHRFQEQFAFIFNDVYMMSHPLIGEKFKELSLNTIQICEAAITMAIRMGNMKPEPFSGAYHNLSISIWTITLFWLQQQSMRTVDDPMEGAKVVWSLILPHFTEKGLASFKAFFGDSFYNNLGQPFDMAIPSNFF